MTLFGQTFDGQQVFGVVSLVAVLALWLMVLTRHKEHRRRDGHDPGRRSKIHRNGGPPAPRGPWG